LIIVVGLLAMICTCSVAWKWGARPERLGATLLAVSWIVVILGQLILPRYSTLPVVIGDCVYGPGLLILSAKYWRVWTWLSVVLEAIAFFIHASMYQGLINTSYAYAAALNGISVLELLALLVASLLNLGAPRSKP